MVRHGWDVFLSAAAGARVNHEGMTRRVVILGAGTGEH